MLEQRLLGENISQDDGVVTQGPRRRSRAGPAASARGEAMPHP
jgi:hypothetical protein